MSETAKECAYCGAAEDRLEDDHVPPKALFAKPRPTLITVPSCKQCHGGTSKDDEYFKMALSMRHDVADQPDVSGGVLDSVMRSLGRPAARGFAQSLFNTIREVPVKTPAGLYLGNVGTYAVDGERIARVIERTVRGLFFHHTRQVLGAEYGVKAFERSLVDWRVIEREQVEALQRTEAALAASEQTDIGNAFQYSKWFAEQDARVSAWRFRIYRAVIFLAITGPNSPA